MSMLAAFAFALLPQQGLRLSGTVNGPEGPLSGATVFISRARPRRGAGIL